MVEGGIELEIVDYTWFERGNGEKGGRTLLGRWQRDNEKEGMRKAKQQ